MNQNLVIQSDLFGMVKWPFQGVKWPPTRGWTGHFESPGRCCKIPVTTHVFGSQPFPVMPKQLHGVSFKRSIIHHMVHIGLGRFQRRKTSNVHLGIGGMFQGFPWISPKNCAWSLGWCHIMTTVGGGNSNIVYFYPDSWGDDPIWRIFFRWVETTSWQWVNGSQSAMTGTKDVGPVPPTEEPQVTQAWVFVCLFVCVAVLRLGDWYWSWTKTVFWRGLKQKSDWLICGNNHLTIKVTLVFRNHCIFGKQKCDFPPTPMFFEKF